MQTIWAWFATVFKCEHNLDLLSIWSNITMKAWLLAKQENNLILHLHGIHTQNNTQTRWLMEKKMSYEKSQPEEYCCLKSCSSKSTKVVLPILSTFPFLLAIDQRTNITCTKWDARPFRHQIVKRFGCHFHTLEETNLFHNCCMKWRRAERGARGELLSIADKSEYLRPPAGRWRIWKPDIYNTMYLISTRFSIRDRSIQ